MPPAQTAVASISGEHPVGSNELAPPPVAAQEVTPTPRTAAQEVASPPPSAAQEVTPQTGASQPFQTSSNTQSVSSMLESFAFEETRDGYADNDQFTLA